MPSSRTVLSLRARLLLWFLVVAAAPLLLAGGILWQRQAADARLEAFSKLEAIRDLKVARIEGWVDEISGDLREFSTDARQILAPEGVLLPDVTPAMTARLRDRFRNYLRNHRLLTEVLLVDGATGRVLVSSDHASEEGDRSDTDAFQVAVRTRASAIGDMAAAPVSHAPRLSFAAPVLPPRGDGPVAAVVVGDVDLDWLNDLLQDQVGMGATGETLVVNQQVVALNELRHVRGAPLKLKIGAQPSVRAARGETAVIESNDYRGAKVLAAFTFLPRLRWGVVAKQDQAEVYAPVASIGRTVLVALGAALLLALALASLVARSLARPVQTMQSTAEAIRSGQRAARNRLARTDELGALAGTFDAMADHLDTQLSVEAGSHLVLEAMVHPVTVEEFAAALLRATLEATGSELGAVYLADRAGRLSPAASLGLSAEALQPFDGVSAEGALGAAVARREVQHLRQVPPDTRFTYRTLAGTAVPRALLAVPLVVQDRVAAVLALGALHDYPPAALSVLERSRVAMSIGLANLLASQETGRLARQLADRNAELQAQASELESQAAELQKQSDALEGQNLELERQSSRVAEASRLKSEFLSNMSHELRTPLNSVLALSRVLQLQAQARLSAEEASYLAIIERNGKHLLALINDILDLAKIESGRMEVATEEVALPALAGAVVEALEPLAREKGIGLVLDLEPGLPALRTDGRKLHQVLFNVVGNAVKFTEVGGVTVTARRRGPALEVAVADTGIGIPAHALPTIFDEFRQVDGSTSRSFEGTGLGLAIAARSARLLGGRIDVRSTPGAGSTFTVTLPLDAAAPASAAPRPVEAPPLSPGQRLVLVVDDVEADAQLLARQLERVGYATVVAHSGAEALRLAEQLQPFAITLDVIMPGLDGWEVLLGLKRNPLTAAIPVIVVSISEDRSTGLALGAFGLVQKPVDPDALVGELRRLAGLDVPAVLVVDDDDGDRSRLAALLEARGLVVRRAHDGREALAMVRQQPPDALTLDLVMPGLGGLEVLDALRADPATHHLPVVIVTAKDLGPEERERLRGRVEAVVEKSRLTAAEVPAEIARLLGGLGATPRQAPAPPAPTASAEEGARLLLVEDSEPAILQIKLVLETAGYRVDVARGGREALALMGQPPPDGIILDLMMPQVDGFAVLEQLRGTPATAAVPVLILTAKDLTREDLSRLSANHVRQLVQKGDVDREQLLRKVALLLGRGEPGPTRPPAPVPRVAAAPPPRGAGARPTVLAVEDNPDNMTTLRAVLGGRWALLEACDGEEGLDLAVRHLPDLVLLDMSLPKLDGLAVLARLRAHPEARRLRVVALTAHAMKGDRERLIAAGCDDYLPKPIDVDQLVAAVARWTAHPGGEGA